MALNYFAPVKLALSLIPQLVQHQGQIVTISAANVLLIPAPKWSAYQASKIAFDQWLRSVSPELRAKQVAVSHIYLPLVKTRMIEPTEAYKNFPAMSAEHAAKIVCKQIITRNRKFKPWWLIFGEIGSLVFRSPIEFFMKNDNTK
jgi:short-subunit dehydrogenase